MNSREEQGQEEAEEDKETDLEHPGNEVLPGSAVLQLAKAVQQDVAGCKQVLPQTALLAGGVPGGITLTALHHPYMFLGSMLWTVRS